MKTTRRTKRGARRLFTVCRVGAVLDEDRARHVAQRLGGSRRREALALLSDFYRLVRLDRDRRTAVVESAVPLPPDVRDDVNLRLARRYGAGLRTTFAQDRGLIGGVRIKVGSDVFDSSVRARLRALESQW